MRITEIFCSIQGESTLAGRPCTFVRLTGCNLRCTWCDTTYSFHGGHEMTLDAVLEAVRGFAVTFVCITGGEPLLQRDCAALCQRLLDEGYTVSVETSGSRDISGLPAGVRRIVDVKCPASGEAHANLWPNLALLTALDEVKFVVQDRADYDFALGVTRERLTPTPAALLFSPVWGRLDPETLGRWLIEDKVTARLQLQLHKYIYGAERTGV